MRSEYERNSAAAWRRSRRRTAAGRAGAGRLLV